MDMFHLPPDLERKLIEKEMQIKGEGEMKKISVLFVDIINFHNLFKMHDDKTILAIIDLYFRVLESIVKKYDGIIPWIGGGGLMAVWGLPAMQKSDAYNAVRAAIEMRMEMFHLIPELVRIGSLPLEIGIGIGTGKAISGFVGPSARRDFTLVGSCVNRGDRLKSIASDNRIFIDKTTAGEVKLLSYLLPIQQITKKYGMDDIKAYEVEGIYEFNPEFESVRRHPRFLVAKIIGITRVESKQRKAGLIKSISEGGLGIELHDHKDFILNIGDKTIFDSRQLSLLGRDEVKGVVIRKEEYKSDGIFRLKTWDIGVRMMELSEEVIKRLQRVAVGKEIM